MSKFSGKCDVGDTYEILGERMKNAKVYIGDNIIPLRIDSEKDALPYFPFLVGSMASSDESTTIRLGSSSYVDVPEQEILDREWEYLRKRYRKLAKNGTPSVEALLEDGFFKDRDYGDAMAESMIEQKGKGERPDLSISYLDHYRDTLYHELLANGYEENEAYRWAYGFRRWLNRLADKAEV